MAEVREMEYIPEGWGVIEGAMTAPCGYVWINNRKSLFGGEYEHAIVSEEIIKKEGNNEINLSEFESGNGEERQVLQGLA